uniref:Uncharacterized protein n=1 Tax=Acrobeloides nanus TaxID=290746 RepID=A0A914D5U0_9BILA
MQDNRVPHLPLFHDLPNNYFNSHNKTIRAFMYAYRNISDKFEWYYRKFLRKYDPNEPHFLGSWIYQYNKTFPDNGYNQGGGYVLSNKALQLLVEEIEKNDTFCKEYLFEDLSVAK